MRTDIVGWFDDTSNIPAHDPGVEGGICGVCNLPLELPVQTICLMPVGHNRSYFFRNHKACWEECGPEAQSAIESQLIDEVCESK